MLVAERRWKKSQSTATVWLDGGRQGQNSVFQNGAIYLPGSQATGWLLASGGDQSYLYSSFSLKLPYTSLSWLVETDLLDIHTGWRSRYKKADIYFTDQALATGEWGTGIWPRVRQERSTFFSHSFTLLPLPLAAFLLSLFRADLRLFDFHKVLLWLSSQASLSIPLLLHYQEESNVKKHKWEKLTRFRC